MFLIFIFYLISLFATGIEIKRETLNYRLQELKLIEKLSQRLKKCQCKTQKTDNTEHEM